MRPHDRFGPADFLIPGEYGNGVTVSGLYITVTSPSIQVISDQQLLLVNRSVLLAAAEWRRLRG